MNASIFSQVWEWTHSGGRQTAKLPDLAAVTWDTCFLFAKLPKIPEYLFSILQLSFYLGKRHFMKRCYGWNSSNSRCSERVGNCLCFRDYHNNLFWQQAKNLFCLVWQFDSLAFVWWDHRRPYKKKPSCQTREDTKIRTYDWLKNYLVWQLGNGDEVKSKYGRHRLFRTFAREMEFKIHNVC